MATEQQDSIEQLDRELEQMLEEQETFEPPEEFARNAVVQDDSLWREADDDFRAFWLRQAKERLEWFKEPEQSLNDENPPFYKWFEDGTLNASYNCLDRWVEKGRGDQVAFHWRGEEGEHEEWTYADLLRDVQRLANGLKSLGIEKGDVVGIFLPMVPEVVVAMLACARIGAPHNVVFGGFSPESVKERMEVSEAKALITADGARRKGETAEVKQAVDKEGIGDLDHIEHIVVLRRTGAVRPLRRAPSAVISTLASENSIRSRTDSALKPPNTTLWTAPMRAQASIATATSGIIGRKIPTRSPWPTPSAASANAARSTSRRSSSRVRSRTAPSSPSQVSAVSCGAVAARSSTAMRT